MDIRAETVEAQNAELIRSFHQMWDAFPGMARLINKKHEVLASNGAAQEKGFVPGAICSRVASPTARRGCLLGEVLRTGKAGFDLPNPHLLRGWVPVLGVEGIVVHFSITLPETPQTGGQTAL